MCDSECIISWWRSRVLSVYLTVNTILQCTLQYIHYKSNMADLTLYKPVRRSILCFFLCLFLSDVVSFQAISCMISMPMHIIQHACMNKLFENK